MKSHLRLAGLLWPNPVRFGQEIDVATQDSTVDLALSWPGKCDDLDQIGLIDPIAAVMRCCAESGFRECRSNPESMCLDHTDRTAPNG